jgi:hypothetical protein
VERLKRHRAVSLANDGTLLLLSLRIRLERGQLPKKPTNADPNKIKEGKSRWHENP